MAGSTIGKILRLTVFGESHGASVGAVLDGFPANFEIDLEYIQNQLDRRKPGFSALTSPRKEADKVRILSGVFEGKTTGTPITFLIENTNHQSKDYDALKEVYRPSHADYSYEKKYGIRDHRGGGRSSARITAGMVAAGALTEVLLKQYNIQIFAYVSSIYDVNLSKKHTEINNADIDKNELRCPDETIARQMKQAIEKAKADGDSLGGIITCVVRNCPAGLGEPIFDKLQADLAKAMMNINAVKGFEYGNGFEATKLKGSENNDFYQKTDKNTTTNSNYSGGIVGGISNGEDIFFRVAFKPVSSISKAQNMLDKNGNMQEIKIEGRHDACVVPRAVPIVESLCKLVISDHLLCQQIHKINH